jgi:hypothetical protein
MMKHENHGLGGPICPNMDGLYFLNPLKTRIWEILLPEPAANYKGA